MFSVLIIFFRSVTISFFLAISLRSIFGIAKLLIKNILHPKRLSVKKVSKDYLSILSIFSIALLMFSREAAKLNLT